MRLLSVILTLGLLTTACAQDPVNEGAGGSPGSGGKGGNGGTSSTGGSKNTGGTTSTGGSKASGGTTSTGGSKASGGTTSTGGTKSTGGTQSTPTVDCTDTSSLSATITDQYGSMVIPVDGNANKTYFMHANWWGSPWNNQQERISGIGFTMTNPPPNNVTSKTHTPMGYPSIFIGNYQGKGTKGSNLPKQISSLTSVPTVFSTNASDIGSKGYNAAYDVWLTKTSATLGSTASSPGTDGAYLMVWLFNMDDEQPRGTKVADGRSIPGAPGAWSVWVDNTNPSCVSYVSLTKLSSIEYDLNDFLKDAVKNKYGNITESQYLNVVFAGFEVWGGADGAQIKKFCADVK